jgi:hypothetical protein
MFPLILVTQAVVGTVAVAGALVVGAVGGVVFHEPLRRAAKSFSKSALHGADLVNDGLRAMRAEMEDARAEVEAERNPRGSPEDDESRDRRAGNGRDRQSASRTS